MMNCRHPELNIADFPSPHKRPLGPADSSLIKTRLISHAIMDHGRTASDLEPFGQALPLATLKASVIASARGKRRNAAAIRRALDGVPLSWALPSSPSGIPAFSAVPYGKLGAHKSIIRSWGA